MLVKEVFKQACLSKKFILLNSGLSQDFDFGFQLKFVKLLKND